MRRMGIGLPGAVAMALAMAVSPLLAVEDDRPRTPDNEPTPRGRTLEPARPQRKALTIHDETRLQRAADKRRRQAARQAKGMRT